MKDLFVNKLRADLILLAIMPGGENLLAEGEMPGSVLLLPSSPFNFLFTLGDGVHQVLPTAAQSQNLKRRNIQRNSISTSSTLSD